MRTLSTFMTLATALVLLVAGCATAPPKIAETPSGRPEVNIFGVDLAKVSNAIINEMQNHGYLLEDQSSNSLFFAREMEGGQAVMAQLVLGNSYSTIPKAEVRFTLSKPSEEVRVVAYLSMSSQTALGQTNRHDMKDNHTWFNVSGHSRPLLTGAVQV